MIQLDAITAADVLIFCYENIKRDVGIAFSSRRRMEEFAKSLHRQQREGLVPATHYKNKIDELFFATGSRIKMFDASDPRNVYGRIFDIVVYDQKITDEDIKMHLESCERRQANMLFKNWFYHHAAKPDMEIDPQPLDDFLGGFSVIKN